jgi:hypothetical protein
MAAERKVMPSMRIRDRHAEIFGKNWLSKNQGHRRKLITDVTDN